MTISKAKKILLFQSSIFQLHFLPKNIHGRLDQQMELVLGLLSILFIQQTFNCLVLQFWLFVQRNGSFGGNSDRFFHHRIRSRSLFLE